MNAEPLRRLLVLLVAVASLAPCAALAGDPPLPAASCPPDDGASRLYEVWSGDYDGDLVEDVYLQPASFVDTIPIPYSIGVDVGRTSTLADRVLRANGDGTYTLIASPNPATLAAVPWAAGRHVPHVGDFDGDGARDLMLQAKFDGETSLVLLSIDLAPALSQAIVGAALGSEITEQSGVTVCAQDLNVDGRDDLLARSASDQVGYAGVTGILGTLVPYPPCTLAGGERDSDCDGVADRDDALAFDPSETTDTDGDGIGDAADPDRDGDGVANGVDPYPLDRNDGQAVGATPGQVNVSSLGKASYRIPIRMVPSVANVAPSLSIAYDGQSGNNLMGMGFYVEGLSQITRCPTTISQDGYRNGVNYDSSDRFCLDGNRLVAVSGAYGADGTEYRTERETFARIVSHGSLGAGPASFTVQRRSGEIESYGLSANSRRMHQSNGAVFSWSIERVEDREGNYATFTYTSNTAAGTHRIDRIDYTGNTAAGLAAANSVRFSYETRNDQLPSHRDSTLMLMDQRMTRISAYRGASEAWHYDLGYTATITPGGDYDGVGGRSRLKTVTECTADTGCLPPTVFTWDVVPAQPSLGSPVEQSDTSSYPAASTFANQQYLIGDVNGDGKSDIVWTYRDDATLGYALYTADATGDGFTLHGPFLETGFAANTVPDAQQRFLLQDVNGDGKSDLVWAARYASGLYRAIYLANATGDGFVPQGYEVDVDSTYGTAVNDHFASADVDGDGRQDLVWVYDKPGEVGRAVYLARAGTGGAPSLVKSSFEKDTGLTPEYYGNNAYALGDVNGDGKDDLVWTFTFQDNFVQKVYLASPSGGDFDEISVQLDDQIFPNDQLYSSQQAQLADVNADGKADLVWTYNYSNDLGRVLYLSSVAGTSFVKASSDLGTPAGVTPDNHVAPRVALADLNGDGNLDLAYNYHDAVTLQFGYVWYLADGDGQGFTESISGTEPILSDYENFDYHYADASGDGVADLVWTYNTGQHVLRRVLFTQPQAYPDHIVKITDGLGAEVRLDYAYLAGSSIYTKGSGSAYPQREDSGRGYVVAQLRTSDGVGGYYTKQYRYLGARTDLAGRGFLGFEQRTVVDVPRGLTTVESYRQDFPFIGQLESSVLAHTAGGQAVEKTFRHWTDGVLAQPSGAASHFAYVRDSANVRYDLVDGNEVAARVEVNVYDEPTGNMTAQTRTMGLGFTGAIDGAFDPAGSFAGSDVASVELSVDTTNVFTAELGANWRLGFLESQTMVYGAPGQPSRTVVTEYDPYDASSLLLGEGRQYVGSGVAASNTYTRDAFGNATQVTTQGDDIDGGSIVPQVELAGPFTEGLYPQSRTNAAGHVTALQYDPRFAKVARETDPNARVTDHVYDGFGREVYTRAFDGSETRVLYDPCDATCPALAAYSTTTIVRHPNFPGVVGAPPQTRYFDVLGREIRTVTVGFDGRDIVADTAYDALGRMASTTRPYYPGETVHGYSMSYDVLDRELQRVGTDGHVTTHVYSSDTTFASRVETTESIVTPSGSRDVTTKRYFDALGQVAHVVDALNVPTDMAYDTQGNLRFTRVNGDAATDVVIETDVAGNKTRVVDPDAGEIVFEYDAMARLRRKTQSPTGDTAVEVMTYDTLGRMLTRTEDAGSGVDASTWTYDLNQKPGTLGRLERTGVEVKQFTYDHYARLTQTDDFYDGVGQSAVFSYGYDAFSRRVATTYPSGFGVRTRYDANGYRLKVEDLATGADYWTALEYDAKGNVTREALGNGLQTTRTYSGLRDFTKAIQTGTPANPDSVQSLAYSYDTLGNVYGRTSSRDGVELLSESFTYDDLHRLKTATTTGLAGGGSRQIDYDYDGLGNIKRKSDVSDVDGYAYGANGGGPHAVSSVTLSGSTTQYAYDTRGNMTTADDRTITYNAFDKPTQVTKPGVTLQLGYSVDQRRYYQNVVVGSRTTTTYYYEGGTSERVQEGDQIRFKSYVGGFLVHTVVLNASGPGEGGDVSYLHRDHNGSTEAVTDRNGNLRERYVFAPFGSRRQGDWEDADAAFLAALPDSTFEHTTQGFTGHEHLDAVGIIHMNGRVYEPSLGRFLSPDTYVQFPEASQSYNRYSYVLNNPLSYRDPSGETPITSLPHAEAYDDHTITLGIPDHQGDASASKNPSTVSLDAGRSATSQATRTMGGAVVDMPSRRMTLASRASVRKQVDRAFNVADEPTSRFDSPSTRRASQSREARRDAVVAGGGSNFLVRENPSADATKAWYEIAALGNAAVKRYSDEIENAASQTGVDANLLRTAVYMENSRGYYDAFTGPLNKSIRPANVHVGFWGEALGVSREDLNDPATNLLAGATILSGIEANVRDGNVRAIGTLYNKLGASEVTDYGARFGAIYSIQPWSDSE